MKSSTIRLFFACAAFLLAVFWYQTARAAGLPDVGDLAYDAVTTDTANAAMMKLLGLLAAAGAWFIVRLGLSSGWRALLQDLGAHSKDVVLDVWQTYVEALKAGKADGKLTDAEKDHARELAIAKLKTRLTWRELWKLGGGLLGRIAGLFGTGWGSKLDGVLEGAVETAVAESKREGKAAGLKTSGKDAETQGPPAAAKSSTPS